MQTVTIAQITERLRKLPTDKLVVVYDFVSYLAAAGQALRERLQNLSDYVSIESILRREWDRPEEDAAWANL
jgi:protein tyrosine/serine phosphatase